MSKKTPQPGPPRVTGSSPRLQPRALVLCPTCTGLKMPGPRTQASESPCRLRARSALSTLLTHGHQLPGPSVLPGDEPPEPNPLPSHGNVFGHSLGQVSGHPDSLNPLTPSRCCGSAPPLYPAARRSRRRGLMSAVTRVSSARPPAPREKRRTSLHEHGALPRVPHTPSPRSGETPVPHTPFHLCAGRGQPAHHRKLKSGPSLLRPKSRNTKRGHPRASPVTHPDARPSGAALGSCLFLYLRCLAR